LIDLRISCQELAKMDKDGFLTEENKRKIAESKEKMERIFGFKVPPGYAQAVIDRIQSKTNKQCESLLNLVKSNKNCWKFGPNALREYVMGIIEGDGSYQVSFMQNPWKFLPLVTVTDGVVHSTTKHYMLLLVDSYFGNFVRLDESLSRTETRLSIKNSKVLANIIQFSKEVKFVNKITKIFYFSKGNLRLGGGKAPPPTGVKKFYLRFALLWGRGALPPYPTPKVFENLETTRIDKDFTFKILDHMELYFEPKFFKTSTPERKKRVENSFF